MAINKSKIAIIGCGFVGSTTAFSLLTQGVCDEIVLIDINREKAYGEVMDLKNSIEYLNRNTKVVVGTYEDCKDADIVVITASAPMLENQERSRLGMLESSARIVKSIVEPIMASGFQGHFIVISNPVDIMAYYVYQLSGLPKNQVIGTGTSLDSARLKNFIADLVHVDPRSVYAYTMGEHGDSQMVPWSCVTVGGKAFYDIIEDNKELVGDVNLDELVLETTKAGWEILHRKGTTYYGIATSTVGIIKAILNDENSIIPVSTLLEGEYGQEGIFCGVPAILNRSGVADVLEIHMQDEEMEKFQKSADIIREYCNKLSF
nr:L-lactate dehydrogenase [Anaerosporobacter faecicola]